jgi:hypothetical protein
MSMKAKMPTPVPTTSPSPSRDRDRDRDRGRSRRVVSVGLSQLAFDGLAASDRAAAAVRLQSAVRCYLGDRGANQAAWPYPAFLRGSEPQVDVKLALEIKDDLWHSFEAEAARQDVSPQQLLEHAAFYFVAELDAGRITQRILDDLEATADA